MALVPSPSAAAAMLQLPVLSKRCFGVEGCYVMIRVRGPRHCMIPCNS